MAFPDNSSNKFYGPTPPPTALLKRLVTATENLSIGGGAVLSVFGRTGAVTANGADYASYYLGVNAQAVDVDPSGASISSALSAKSGLASNNAFTGNNTHTGLESFTGAIAEPLTAMAALDIDVTKSVNSYSGNGSQTFTYSGTPASGTWVECRFTASGGSLTPTIPSTWSLTRNANITSLGSISSGNTLVVKLRYVTSPSSRWEVIGDPAATIGSGAYIPLVDGTPVINSGKTASFANTISFSGTDGKTLALNNSITVSSPNGGSDSGVVLSQLSQTFSNTNLASVNAGVTSIIQTGTMTAPHTIAWPLASQYPAGTKLSVIDSSGTLSTTNTITLNRSGSDTINGGTSYVMTTPYAAPVFVSDGGATWVADVQGVPRGGTGNTTLAAHGVLIGNASSPIAVTSAGTAGQALISNGASADPTFQNATSVVQFTSTNASYTPPSNWKSARLIVVGGGGGGGSGARQASGTASSGGSGGGGGSASYFSIDSATVGTGNWNITVGTGGAGHAGSGTDNSNGLSGTAGNDTTVVINSLTVAAVAGGAAGTGGSTGTSSGVSGIGPGQFTSGNSTGCTAGAAGTNMNTTTTRSFGAWGGAGGGGLASSPANTLGGRSVPLSAWASVTLAAADTAGGNGASATSTGLWIPGGGGNGGGGNASTTGGNGGNGYRGGGGGGGGASLNGQTSGAGGNGGDGFVYVVFSL